MSLDDAVNAAKARQEQQAQMARSHQEQERQEEAEIRGLVREATERLSERAPRSEEFVQVSRALLIGGYTSERRRFKVVRRERCWTLASGAACRTPTSQLVPSSVLLLESGRMGRVFEDQVFEPELAGEFVTEAPLAPVPDDDLLWQLMRRSGISRAEALKQELATTLLQYGAA
ncbi:hypothetical protein [Nocardiopsis sp. JB363]|uniref:hypothetical protein n=1 Tax=Nocardiopsis sp. JB363 TaxID=1434837 RepID=UPI00118077B9|nr:hypothetical protein [Nocardiopsis sp. JB363]